MVVYGESDEQFRLPFEAAPNGMIVTDQDGVITFVNKQTEKLFGYSRGELIGRSVEVLIPERFQGAHPSLRAQFATQPKTRAMGAGRDQYGLRKNKTEFPVEIGLNPFRSGDRLLVVASVIDITERKRNEEHIRFIMDELSHCSKNLLSVVLAIANQTVGHATSFSEFQANFESRLMALRVLTICWSRRAGVARRSKRSYSLSSSRSWTSPRRRCGRSTDHVGSARGAKHWPRTPRACDQCDEIWSIVVARGTHHDPVGC